MLEISLLTGELSFAGLWLLVRAVVWLRQRQIDWKREAMLLLLFIDLAVLIRFVFYPFFPVGGRVQPLAVNLRSLAPVRLNLLPLVYIADYDTKREAVINIVGNIALFIPGGIVLPLLDRRLDRFGKAVAGGAAVSMSVVLPNSTTDNDDLILNTLGTALGCGVYFLLRRRIGRRRPHSD